MCCLFGVMDCGHRFSGRERSRMLNLLARACEVRGTDATGIAYNTRGKLRIYKRPLPAHNLRLRIPEDALVIMGHTRLATQGSEKKNYNNHPWRGKAGSTFFALAHNGVLHNDGALRNNLHLPPTRIETDSYVGVQILEQKRALTFDSLKFMAEKVEGSFAFSLLDEDNQLYFVKGDNPLCLYYFPDCRLYLYASTEAILLSALERMPFTLGRPTAIALRCGDILKLDAGGKQSRASFSTAYFDRQWFCDSDFFYHRPVRASSGTFEDFYLEDLKSIAGAFGYTPEDVDALLREGFTTDEIEDALYCCGEL